MAYRHIFFSVQTLTMMTAFSSAAYLSATPVLDRRQSQATCVSGHSLVACPSSVPFCCPTGSSCMSYANNDAVVCCPSGRDCNAFQPISCGIKFYDETQFPTNLIHINPSVLSGATQVTCGSQCCPPGFHCYGGTCFLDENAHFSAAPSSTSSPLPSSTLSAGSTTSSSSTSSLPQSTASGASTTSTAIPSTTANSTSSASSTTTPPPAQPSTSNTGAIAAGAVVGVAGAVALAFLIFCLCRRKRAKQQQDVEDSKLKPFRSRFHPSNGSGSDFNSARSHFATDKPRNLHSRDVSDPVIDPQYGGTHRTDFLLRQHTGQTARTAPPAMSSAQYQHGHSPVRGPVRGPPVFATPLKLGLPANPAPTRPPRSDEDQRTDSGPSGSGDSGRESKHASGETIQVLMPPPLHPDHPEQGRASAQTTFSMMMEQAGLRRGDNFLGYPGRWSFRK